MSDLYLSFAIQRRLRSLPARFITPLFRKLLAETKDEAHIATLIADRRHLARVVTDLHLGEVAALIDQRRRREFDPQAVADAAREVFGEPHRWRDGQRLPDVRELGR